MKLEKQLPKNCVTDAINSMIDARASMVHVTTAKTLSTGLSRREYAGKLCRFNANLSCMLFDLFCVIGNDENHEEFGRTR